MQTSSWSLPAQPWVSGWLSLVAGHAKNLTRYEPPGALQLGNPHWQNVPVAGVHADISACTLYSCIAIYYIAI